MSPALEISHLDKTYGKDLRALQGVSLCVQAGDFFSLLGANGAGKTTLIGIVTGTVQKSGGSVKIFGLDIDTHHAQAKQKIGLVPQEFNFNIFEKVEDIVVQQAGFFGFSRGEALKNAEPILKILNLWSKKNAPARALSGGMKRRLMIARALCHRPELLLLDEPTAGVDVELRAETWEYLRALNAQGVTIVLTTHYLEEAEALCRTAAVIQKGKVVRQGRMQDLIGSVESTTYRVEAEGLKPTLSLPDFEWTLTSENQLEVTLRQTKSINQLVRALDAGGVMIKSIAPAKSRLEQLFMNLLQ